MTQTNKKTRIQRKKHNKHKKQENKTTTKNK